MFEFENNFILMVVHAFVPQFEIGVGVGGVVESRWRPLNRLSPGRPRRIR
jgi:hypothetical protein